VNDIDDLCALSRRITSGDSRGWSETRFDEMSSHSKSRMYVLARNDSIENRSESNGGSVADGKYRVYPIATYILYNTI